MIDLTALSPLQLMAVLALIFLAAVGANHICHALLVGAKSLRHRQAEDPEPQVPAEPQPEPEPIVVVQQARAVPDLLPLPTSAEVAPIFAQVPMRLPAYDSRDWRYTWDKPSDPYATGSFPEIRLEMEDDAVSEPPQRSARSRFPVLPDPAKAEAARLLPRERSKRATVDLEAGTVVVSA